MNQTPTDGKNLLDPFGIWKAARDANLEGWSKLMIETVNSDEYARATGFALEQILATSQPFRDSMEKTMTQTLSMLNMPSRAEVISLAERLVNVEMRLDDMDAKLNAIQSSLQETIKKTVQEAMVIQTSHLKEIANQLDSLQKIQAHLAELSTRFGSTQVPTVAAVQPVVAPRPEPKPTPKAVSQTRHLPTNKDVATVNEQEAR